MLIDRRELNHLGQGGVNFVNSYDHARANIVDCLEHVRHTISPVALELAGTFKRDRANGGDFETGYMPGRGTIEQMGCCALESNLNIIEHSRQSRCSNNNPAVCLRLVCKNRQECRLARPSCTRKERRQLRAASLTHESTLDVTNDLLTPGKMRWYLAEARRKRVFKLHSLIPSLDTALLVSLKSS